MIFTKISQRFRAQLRGAHPKDVYDLPALAIVKIFTMHAELDPPK
jgi:hypothetical protein